ncbi:Polysaccharide deacetylase family protein [Rubrivivax sp. A210]|uniref:polysaccharide deacetylase family protein n=1 Tax=Rubrivivax sp. A210 TaxID=2772301 RepID=UPI001918FB29|nr:polysaccharide deacetylase family protein [Rubrivivax sp. A210]CAD5372050.1 Polysaccharide deacetylase family protein [Rubrivivax sp. A210]
MSAAPPLASAPRPPRWPLPPFITATLGLHGAAAAAALALPGAWPWAAGAVAANHLAITAAGLWPRSTWLGPNVRRLPGGAAQVALTIDDGPDPEVTPAVLDLLAELGVRASFFCIAERARAQPALLRRIVAAGHSVQNHSLRHDHRFSLMGPRGLTREVGDAQALLADLSGVQPQAFRAPAGLRNPFLDPVLHALSLHLVSWTRRGFDTRTADADVVLARLSRGLAAGDILLLHDGNARRGASGRPLLLDVLPPLVARCRAAGLRLVTLAEALPPRHAAA